MSILCPCQVSTTGLGIPQLMQCVLKMQLDAKAEKAWLKIGGLRGFVSDVTNKVFAHWILATLQILLARSSSAIESVIDALAITFITSTDDDMVMKEMQHQFTGGTFSETPFGPSPVWTNGRPAAAWAS